jgi:uncharacterized protein YndB with AHSA1/START domain
MKRVKLSIAAVLGLILLATAALAVAGMGPDSNRLYSSVVIRQAPAAIWPWLYQEDKVKQWVSWLVEVRNNGATEPVRGGKYVWVMEDRNNNNARMDLNWMVDAVEPNQKLAISVEAKEGFHGTSVYTLTAQPGGTTLVESDSRYTFDSGFVRFMSPLVIWQAKKKMNADLDHLRTLVEARP